MSDWIEWYGGKCPVQARALVEVRYRDGDKETRQSGETRWSHLGYPGDVVAYRLAEAEQAPSHAVTAPAILNKAAALMEERGKQYDKPEGERSMGRAVAALNAVLGRPALTESEGWLLLQLLKDVRDRQRAEPHLDSLEDGVAYAALKAESRLQEKASPK